MIPPSFPLALWETITKLYPEDINTIYKGFLSPRMGSFRINTLKEHSSVFVELAEKNISVQKTSLPHIYTFSQTDLFTIKGTRAFYEGKIYLQSIASLLPVLAMDFSGATNILDICAAPGGKTTQMAEYTKNRFPIIALEKNQIRFDKLKHNCTLQGANAVLAKKIDAIKYLQDTKNISFSHILLDAPCSSEGRMQFINEKSFGFWNESTNAKNSEIQKLLLSLALQKLSPNGELIYSTCTISPKENEEVLTTVLLQYPEYTIVPIKGIEIPQKRSGITEWHTEKYLPECVHAIRIIPSSFTEGFFIAKIKRK